MTRINCGIPPSELNSKHLIAEHREIKRIPNCIKSGRFNLNNQPTEFKLNKGHVKFFYTRIGYLKERYIEIHQECLNRNFKVQNFIDVFENIPEIYMGNYIPTKNDVKIVKERINERLNATF